MVATAEKYGKVIFDFLHFSFFTEFCPFLTKIGVKSFDIRFFDPHQNEY